jgi:hypothetical protein
LAARARMAQAVPCGRPAGKTVSQAPRTLHRVGKTVGHREAGFTTRAEPADREIRVRGRRGAIRG